MRKTLSPLIIAAVFWPILNQAEAAVTELLEYRADIPTIAAGFGQSIAIDGNRTLIGGPQRCNRRPLRIGLCVRYVHGPAIVEAHR